MSDNIKLYSEIERYDIINVNDGEKYNCLYDNDLVIDEEGYLKIILLSNSKSKFSILGRDEIIEIPWECVKKIGARTIIIDADSSNVKKNKL